MSRIIAITGGIGSGKSIVSRLLNVMGFPVYDCDSRAITVIQHDCEVKNRLIRLLGEKTYDATGHYDRAWVGQQVFGNPQLLQQVNAIVHPAVMRDLNQWQEECQELPAVFVETALLRQSGLGEKVDRIWRIVAPEQLRIARVQQRNSISREAVVQRIDAQNQKEKPYDNEVTIVNDGCTPVMKQVIAALNDIK